MAFTNNLLFVCCLIFATIKIGESFKMAKLIEQIKAVHSECNPKFQTTIEQISGFQNGEFPDSRSIKCFTNCAMELMNTMRNGKFLYDDVMIMLDNLPAEIQPIAKDIVNSCKDAAVGIIDPCEAAYTQTKCFQNNNPKFFLEL